MKKCVIFGAGVYDGQLPAYEKDILYISADAGILKCRELGIVPDIAIGDFDSLGSVPEEQNVVRLPVEKDITDMDAAVEEAVARGCGEIHIYGGAGGRPDHTLANISLVARLSTMNIKPFMYGEGYVFTAITNGEITVCGEKGKTLSVTAFSDRCTGVNIKNLKYTLDDGVLENTFALGVSNSFTDKKAYVGVEKGTLIVMWEK